MKHSRIVKFRILLGNKDIKERKNINVPPTRTQKVGFYALVPQEMGKGVDIGI